ncbi:unnamed protein product [Prunus armeniaca]
MGVQQNTPHAQPAGQQSLDHSTFISQHPGQRVDHQLLPDTRSAATSGHCRFNRSSTASHDVNQPGPTQLVLTSKKRR